MGTIAKENNKSLYPDILLNLIAIATARSFQDVSIAVDLKFPKKSQIKGGLGELHCVTLFFEDLEFDSALSNSLIKDILANPIQEDKSNQ